MVGSLVLPLWEVCPKCSGVREGLMVLGMGRRPMEEARYLASFSAQDEDIICVAMWSCKSYENKLWFGNTVVSLSYGQC